jgi:hypothetical protein
MMTRLKEFRRGGLILGASASLALASCDTVDRLLEANNPAAIREDQLNSESLVTVLVNSVIGGLTTWYDDPFIWQGSMFTDEQITGINWEGTARLNLRVVRFDGEGNGMFAAASRFRFIADSVSGRLRTLLKDPAKDRRMALVLAYAGYSYTLMAEVMCEATLNVGEKIYTPKELAQLAIPRFEEAITVATAVGSSAADVANLARVGLARAALLTGDKAKVMSAAAQVPLNFVWWVEWKDQVINNVLNARVSGTNHALGVHPRFLNGTFGTQDLIAGQTDPRIQHTTRWSTGHNQLTKLYKPYQSLPFSGYNGGTVAAVGRNCETTPRPAGCPILFETGTDIKLASGLEAMHHYYEAAGPTGTGPQGTTLAFVNARRTFGKQATVNLSGDALMTELREQRARDMYLGGFRLGDLRRWRAAGITDPRHSFPTGTHPNPEWGPYGEATCWPIPLQEYIGNPNVKKSS